MTDMTHLSPFSFNQLCFTLNLVQQNIQWAAENKIQILRFLMKLVSILQCQSQCISLAVAGMSGCQIQYKMQWISISTRIFIFPSKYKISAVQQQHVWSGPVPCYRNIMVAYYTLFQYAITRLNTGRGSRT